MSDHLENRLKQILVDQLPYPLEATAISADTGLYGKGLSLNSLDTTSLMVRLEDEFDIFFEAEEVASCVETFGALLGSIRRKLDQDETDVEVTGN